MRSHDSRLRYSKFRTSSRRTSFRRAGATGIILASLLIAACGGSGGDEECGPEDNSAECNAETPGGGDDGGNGGSGGNNGSGGDDGGNNDGSGDGDSSDVSEIPLDELRDHLHDTPADKRPPEFAEWERNMNDSGHNIGQTIQSSGDLNDVYYDGQYIFRQIADYRGEREPWNGYAERAGDIYQAYVDDGVAGYWRFSHGFLMALEDGDEDAREYLVTMRDDPPFSDPLNGNGSKDNVKRAREIAYALQSQIVAEKGGEPRQEREVEAFVEFALGHIDIWLTGDWISSKDDWQEWTPFQMGLNASALIEYYERSVELGDPDERVLPAIKKMADFLWDEMWIDGAEGSEYGAFRYRVYDGGSTSGATGDLNMLIVSMYGWLYKETGEQRFLERGDEIFGGGVDLAWLGGGKQFNQNYRESFNFLRWRQEGLERFGS